MRSTSKKIAFETTFLVFIKIDRVPSDTYMRGRLDLLSMENLAPAYKKLFALVQRHKALEPYSYLDGYYLISIDGTGHFSSRKVSCKNCCIKEGRDRKVTYYHQMLAAVMVHPDLKEVIPFCPEPINKGDGSTKNDCERNAAKRLIERMRREYPKLKMMVVEDGLASNGPHIRELEKAHMRYVLGAKEGDHPFLFDWVAHSETTEYSHQDSEGIIHKYRFINKVPLNDANFNLRVNFLEYKEVSSRGVKRFTWVSNIELTKNNVYQIIRGARARWRIENETFNTLKNQGYRFEYNFGHGTENLCTVMGLMMLLAFLVDQIQLLCCAVYKRAKQLSGSFQNLWNRMRGLLEFLKVDDWLSFNLKIARLDTS
ncbi:MAG: transposase [Chlamydiia bacterium]|nr:transposase [Chlamydiia bacterium]